MSMDRKEMVQQFQTLAAALEDLPQEQLTAVVLSSCAYLLEQLGCGTKPLEQMNAVERAEIMSGYGQLSDCVDRFAQEARRQLGYDAAIALHEGSMREVEQQARRAQEVQQRKAEVEQRLAQLQEEIRQQAERLVTQEQLLAQLEEVHTNQCNRLRLCDDAALQEVRAQNAALETELERLEAVLMEQTRQKTELQMRRTVAEKAIEQVAQEKRELLDDILQKEAYLERLKKLEQECGLEQQQALKDQIETLEPRVTELEANTRKLQGILQALQAGETTYDAQRQTLSTNVLDLLEEQLDELQQILPEHHAALQQAKTCAQQMHSSLQECKTLAEGYRVWFEQDRRPLDAWMAAVRAPEYAQLREVLNLRECSRVKELVSRMEQALEEMDALLVQCTAAIRKDQKTIERKANGR